MQTAQEPGYLIFTVPYQQQILLKEIVICKH